MSVMEIHEYNRREHEKDIFQLLLEYTGAEELNNRKEDYKRLLFQSETFVAYMKDELVAYTRCIQDGGFNVWIVELLVNPRFQSQGIGGRLLEYVKSLYPFEDVYVLSEEDEYYMKKSYKKIGSIFEITRR